MFLMSVYFANKIVFIQMCYVLTIFRAWAPLDRGIFATFCVRYFESIVYVLLTRRHWWQIKWITLCGWSGLVWQFREKALLRYDDELSSSSRRQIKVPASPSCCRGCRHRRRQFAIPREWQVVSDGPISKTYAVGTRSVLEYTWHCSVCFGPCNQ